MVYVNDVARAIMLCIEKTKANGKTYILSAPEIMTYDRYIDLLKAVSDRNFITIPVTIADVITQNIALPFPLTSKENALFNGEKIVRELGFKYGDLKYSMK